MPNTEERLINGIQDHSLCNLCFSFILIIKHSRIQRVKVNQNSYSNRSVLKLPQKLQEKSLPIIYLKKKKKTTQRTSVLIQHYSFALLRPSFCLISKHPRVQRVKTKQKSNFANSISVERLSLKIPGTTHDQTKRKLDNEHQYDFPQCIKLPQPRKRPNTAALPTVVWPMNLIFNSPGTCRVISILNEVVKSSMMVR